MLKVNDQPILSVEVNLYSRNRELIGTITLGSFFTMTLRNDGDFDLSGDTISVQLGRNGTNRSEQG